MLGKDRKILAAYVVGECEELKRENRALKIEIERKDSRIQALMNTIEALKEEVSNMKEE